MQFLATRIGTTGVLAFLLISAGSTGAQERPADPGLNPWRLFAQEARPGEEPRPGVRPGEKPPERQDQPEPRPEDEVQLEEVPAEIFEGVVDAVTRPSEIGVLRPGRVDLAPRGRLRLGDVRIFPLLEEEVIFDNNVFRTETDKKSAILFLTRTGLFTETDFGHEREHRLRVGYQADFNNYNHTAPDYIEQFAGGDLRLHFHKLTFEAGDKYERREYPVELDTTDFMRRTINTGYGQGRVDLARLFVQFRVEREDSHYSGAEFRNASRAETRFTTDLGVKVTDRTEAFLEHSYEDRDFDRPFYNEGDLNTFAVGGRTIFSDRFEAQAKVGVQQYSGEDDRPIGDDDAGETSGYASMAARWRVVKAGELEASYLRTNQFSFVANFQITDRVDASYTHTLARNLIGRFGTYFEHANPSQGGNLNRAGAGLGFQYLITEGVRVGADYEFVNRISAREEDGDYSNHRLAFRFTVLF